MKIMLNILKIVCILMVLTFLQVRAQDGHYWTENYGNKSMLLSGTINASVNDLGAVYYNPGRLGQIENPAFVINAKVYEWRTLKVEDGVDEGVDLSKSNFGGAPNLVAGTFSLPFLENHKFAYSFLTRQRTEADFFIRVEEEGDVVEVMPGNEIFNGKFNFKENLKEEWIGLTWSYPFTEKFSAGLSTFLSVLNKSNGLMLNMNALGETNNVATLMIDRQYSYENYGMVWKMGMALDLAKVNLGMTITTPRANFQGKGNTLFEDYLVGVDTTGDGSIDDGYIFNIQNGLNARYRYPWAIGFGMGIHFKKAILHLSAEWFDKVHRYEIMRTDPFIGQSTGDTLSFALVDELDPVINFGIGLEYDISEKFSLYASFASDYSAVSSNITRFAELEEEASNSAFQMDFYKFGGGFAINTKAVEITIGVTYTGADQEFRRPIDFPEEGEEDPVFDSDDTATLKFSQWRFVLGFSFPFADKMAKKLDSESED
jgi:hypothetical protein